jgi:hypothetical protein
MVSDAEADASRCIDAISLHQNSKRHALLELSMHFFFLFRTCSHKTRTGNTTFHEDLFFIFVKIIVRKYLGSLGALKVNANFFYINWI